VEKRLRTNVQRDDILNKLIEARLKETGKLSELQITELTAEAVSIL
jgi:benzoate 4-monooxygenase